MRDHYGVRDNSRIRTYTKKFVSNFIRDNIRKNIYLTETQQKQLYPDQIIIGV